MSDQPKSGHEVPTIALLDDLSSRLKTRSACLQREASESHSPQYSHDLRQRAYSLNEVITAIAEVISSNNKDQVHEPA